MKFLIILLLAINAFLFSFWNGWISPWDNREPERLRRQVDAERISVLSANGSPKAEGGASLSAPAAPGAAAAGATGNAPATPGSTPSKPPGDAAASPEAAARAPASPVCMEFPALEPDKARSLETSLKQAGLQVEARTLEASISYLVFLPPSESLREAQRKLAELKRLGVEEAYLFTEGPMRLGISLGLFRLEEGARTRVQELSGKGIRAARIAQSPGSRPARTVLRVTGQEAQMSSVRQAAGEVNLSLKTCEP